MLGHRTFCRPRCAQYTPGHWRETILRTFFGGFLRRASSALILSRGVGLAAQEAVAASSRTIDPYSRRLGLLRGLVVVIMIDKPINFRLK